MVNKGGYAGNLASWLCGWMACALWPDPAICGLPPNLHVAPRQLRGKLQAGIDSLFFAVFLGKLEKHSFMSLFLIQQKQLDTTFLGVVIVYKK